MPGVPSLFFSGFLLLDCILGRSLSADDLLCFPSAIKSPGGVI